MTLIEKIDKEVNIAMHCWTKLNKEIMTKAKVRRRRRSRIKKKRMVIIAIIV